MRTEHETMLIQKLMARLNSQVGVPNASDLEEIEHLLEVTGDIPVSEDELRALYVKVREIHGRRDEPAFLREVGRRLAKGRRAAGFKPREIADRLQLTPGELKLIETGRQAATFHECVRLAELFDLSLDGLVEGLR
jgi:ribosome-binding protein aMBF1 (putative translation factor)